MKSGQCACMKGWAGVSKCLPLITDDCQEISLDQGLSCQCAEGSCVRNTSVKKICNIMFKCGNGRLDEGEYCDPFARYLPNYLFLFISIL